MSKNKPALSLASLPCTNTACGRYNGKTETTEPTPTQMTYGVYGVGVSEVLVDVLTGEARIERVDLMMDIGNQLDAAVDVGQIQGAYVKSLGYLFTEELKWNSDAQQLHLGTWECVSASPFQYLSLCFSLLSFVCYFLYLHCAPVLPNCDCPFVHTAAV